MQDLRELDHALSKVHRRQVLSDLGLQPAGIGKCPILGLLDITKNSSHYRPLIPDGWVMFNGDMTNDPWPI